MKYFFSGVCLILFQLWLYPVIAVAGCGRQECTVNARAQPLEDIDAVKGRLISLNVEHIKTAAEAVPRQSKDENTKDWSCASNSIIRSLILITGHRFFENEKEYIQFAEAMPKTLGPYSEHRFDHIFNLKNRYLNGIYQYIRETYFPIMFQTVCGKSHINVGPLPVWLYQYMRCYVCAYTKRQFVFERYSSSNFTDTLEKLKKMIRQGSAAIPLVVFEAMRWHYLNIVGYDDESQSVVVLDTDSKLYLWSYGTLECLMNTGFNVDSLMIDECLFSIFSNLGNLFSEIDYFNLIFVSIPAQ